MKTRRMDVNQHLRFWASTSSAAENPSPPLRTIGAWHGELLLQLAWEVSNVNDAARRLRFATARETLSVVGGVNALLWPTGKEST